MNNKILIEIIVPMIQEEYDIYIPVSKSVRQATQLLIKSINELSDGHFPIKDNNILLKENGDVLAQNLTIKDNGIKNGDKIILI